MTSQGPEGGAQGAPPPDPAPAWAGVYVLRTCRTRSKEVPFTDSTRGHPVAAPVPTPHRGALAPATRTSPTRGVPPVSPPLAPAGPRPQAAATRRDP